MLKRMKESVGLRILLIGFISLILLIPAGMVTNMVTEREKTRNEAVREVSEKWGCAQTISGPLLTVPLKKHYKDENGKIYSKIEYAHFLPDALLIQGNMQPEVRYRGIYQVILYGSGLRLSGNFALPDMKEFDVRGEDILWRDAFVSLGISDMKGIREQISLTWNNATFTAEPGIPTNDVFASGVSVRIPVNEQNGTYAFSVELSLNGSRELNFAPVGKETSVEVTSNWTSPSFQGSFLPIQREISGSGFSARWKVLQLNRNYPQRWLGKHYDLSRSTFGVNLVRPVDEYQKTTRTTKYAAMFIMLTFAAFFVIEILNRRAIHPVQYFLVGLALVLFYTLVLSLSEHISFQWSYLAASISTIALISAYTRSMFTGKLLPMIVGGLLAALYGFLYIVLQLEDYALLLGSLGLFGMLGLFMYLTRNIDWYRAFVPDNRAALSQQE